MDDVIGTIPLVHSVLKLMLEINNVLMLVSCLDTKAIVQGDQELSRCPFLVDLFREELKLPEQLFVLAESNSSTINQLLED